MNGIGKVQAEKTVKKGVEKGVNFLNAKVNNIEDLKTIGKEALDTPIGILDAEKARANFLPKNLL